MAKLRVKRSSEWINRTRGFGLYLDENKIGVIANGETKEFDLEPGKYQLMAKIDWCQSQILEFELLENETKTIDVAGIKYGNVIIPLFVLMFFGYFFLSIVFDVNVILLIFAGMAVYLYPVYYITFGRKSYIRMNESG